MVVVVLSCVRAGARVPVCAGGKRPAARRGRAQYYILRLPTVVVVRTVVAATPTMIAFAAGRGARCFTGGGSDCDPSNTASYRI